MTMRAFDLSWVIVFALYSAAASSGTPGVPDGSLPEGLQCLEQAVASESLSAPALPKPEYSSVVKRGAPRASNLRWSDDRTLVADFVDYRTRGNAVNSISVATGAVTPLAAGQRTASSPDGRFVIGIDGDRWVLKELRTGRLQNIETGKWGTGRSAPVIGQPTWSPDSRYVVLAETDKHIGGPKPEEVLVDTVRLRPARVKDEASASVSTRLTIVDVSGAPRSYRYSIDGEVRNLSWSPKGEIYFSRSVWGADREERSTTISRLVPGGAGPMKIYRTPGMFQNSTPRISSNGRWLAMSLDVDNRSWDDFDSLVLLDIRHGFVEKRLTTLQAVHGDEYVWSPAGDRLFFVSRHGGLNDVASVDLGGRVKIIRTAMRQHADIAISPNGSKLAYTTLDLFGRRDIRVFDLRTRTERVLLALDDPTKEFNLGRNLQLRWQSAPGVNPFGFLVLPPDFDGSKSYPMIVDIHGGGPGSYLYLQAPLSLGPAPGPLEWHAWAALGYVVFMPDYRSSGEYGPEVAAARYAQGVDGIDDDAADVAQGIKSLLACGFLDRNRVHIVGHSAGGPRAYALLLRGENYASAVLNEAVAPDTLSTMLGASTGPSTGGYWEGAFNSIFGPLGEHPERYKRNRIFDAYRVDTPLLIMMGEPEYGGSDPQPYEAIYSIMRQRRVPSEMITFVAEGHNHSTPASANVAFEKARYWFEAHPSSVAPGP